MASDHESSAGGSAHPSDDAVSRVRPAIRRYLARESTDVELRSALRDLARDAEARSLRAEELVVALKRLLGELPEVQRIGERTERERVVARLVSTCIDVYYDRRDGNH
jgi:hypothetical protein